MPIGGGRNARDWLATVKGVSAGLPVRDVSQDRWLAGLALFRQPGHTGGWPVENCVVTMT
jgi:hypothetical protein